MDLYSQISNKIKENIIILSRKIERIKQELHETEEKKEFWEQLDTFLQKNWVFQLSKLIEKEKFLIEHIKNEEDKASLEILEKVYSFAKEEAKKIMRNYPKLLEDAIKNTSLSIEWDSSHPIYKLKKGFFTLKIDENKGIAKLYDYEGKIAEFPADIELLIKTLEKEHQRIFNRKFNGEKFLKLLRTNYLQIIKKQNKTDGSVIRIRDITGRLGKNKKGFRTDEFLIDLSRLIKEGPLEIDGRKLDLQQIKGDKGGMLLYDVNISGYVGYISFKEV